MLFSQLWQDPTIPRVAQHCAGVQMVSAIHVTSAPSQCSHQFPLHSSFMSNSGILARVCICHFLQMCKLTEL